MHFKLRQYSQPNFSAPALAAAPDATLLPAPLDGVAPEGFHATTIFPEYFKVAGTWLLAEESRMDCSAVLEQGKVVVREFRHLRKGDLVFCARTEDGQGGIFVHTNGFDDTPQDCGERFAFRQGRSRETAFSMDYDFLYEQLRYEREHGYIVWVAGPACSFDADSRNAFSRLCDNGYVHALLAGNALATHDLEAAYKKSALGQDLYTQFTYPLGHYNHLD
ncbi:MAG: hypothetical protein LBP91_04400, partial [Coriobacteriales bacterium]|nr:hypothetical protein [Coriobacteriales bacterium]